MKELADITSREDIKLLIGSFYQKAMADEVIGFFFTQVVQLDMEKHMPTMYDFWETTLLHNPIYKDNPMKVHLALNGKHPMEDAHFDRWLMLFSETVDEHFSGPTAEMAKTRALSIATLMRIKIKQV